MKRMIASNAVVLVALILGLPFAAVADDPASPETAKPDKDDIRLEVPKDWKAGCSIDAEGINPDDPKKGHRITCVPRRATAEELNIGTDRKKDVEPAIRFMLAGAKFSFEGGRTNEDGFSEDGVALPVHFDNAINTWKMTVGYSKKKVLKDMINLVERYRGEEGKPLGRDGEDHRAWRELIVDAVSLDVQYGYGRTAKSLVDGSRNIDKRSTFRVQAKYEVDLETLFAHTQRGATHVWERVTGR